MNEPTRALQWTLTGLGAFAFGTLGWIWMGLQVRGDYFAPGLVGVLPFPILVSLGGFLGYRARHPAAVLCIAAAAGASVLFWIETPDGWWASAPPQREHANHAQ